MKVIALSGYKGSGKDTVATMLSEYNYQRFSTTCFRRKTHRK